MWTEITSTTQLARLKKEDEILHHPNNNGPKVSNPTCNESNSTIYKVQSVEEDLVVLYSIGREKETIHYSSRGLDPQTMLNGTWWIKQKK